jgi:hypothetical protein
MDLQTINFGTNPAQVKSVKIVYDVQLGAGTYDGKEANGKFEIFEKKHEGDVKGTIKWLGEVHKYKIEIEVPIAEPAKRTFKGPFDE